MRPCCGNRAIYDDVGRGGMGSESAGKHREGCVCEHWRLGGSDGSGGRFRSGGGHAHFVSMRSRLQRYVWIFQSCVESMVYAHSGI